MSGQGSRRRRLTRPALAFAVTFVALTSALGTSACTPTVTCRHWGWAKFTMNYTGGMVPNKTVAEQRNHTKWSTTGYGDSQSECYGLDARAASFSSNSECYRSHFGVILTDMADCQRILLKNGPTYIHTDQYGKYDWRDVIQPSDPDTGRYTMHSTIYDHENVNKPTMNWEFNVINGGSPYGGYYNLAFDWNSDRGK